MPIDPRHGPRATAVGFVMLRALIAVAALSVLSAILLARLNPAPQSACIANMQHLGLAMAQYVQDSDQCFPPKFYEGPQGWAGRIYPYVKSPALYKCPEDATGVSGSAVPVSYAINSNLTSRFSQLKMPASTDLLFEVSGAQVEVGKMDEGSNNWIGTPPSKMISPCGRGLPTDSEGYPNGQMGRGKLITYATGSIGGRDKLALGPSNAARHSGGSNFLGADGHVAYLLPRQVSSGADGVFGNPQDHLGLGQAAATDKLFLSDGTTPVNLTFSTQ